MPTSHSTTTRLRVVHVLDSFEIGGAQRVALQLSKWLTEKGVDVIVVGQAGPLASMAPAGVGIVESERGGFLREFMALARLCRRYRPHVLHAHQRREALLSILVGAIFRIPVVEHAHTYLPHRGLKSISFRSKKIFAVSEQVRTMVVDAFKRSPTRVLSIGNTPASVTPYPVVPRRTVTQPLRLIGVGRLVSQKDPLRFVRVVAEASRLVDVEATWFGGGPLLDEAERLARELNAPVSFAGHTTAIAYHLDSADALLMTSAWEGMPLIVLEAFARNRPVVATAATGSPGVLGDGRGIVVADDTTPDAFAAALVNGLADEGSVTQQIRAAQLFLDEKTTPETVFGPVLSTYHDVTG